MRLFSEGGKIWALEPEAWFNPSSAASERLIGAVREAVVNCGACHQGPWLAASTSRSLSFLFPEMGIITLPLKGARED